MLDVEVGHEADDLERAVEGANPDGAVMFIDTTAALETRRHPAILVYASKLPGTAPRRFVVSPSVLTLATAASFFLLVHSLKNFNVSAYAARLSCTVGVAESVQTDLGKCPLHLSGHS